MAITRVQEAIDNVGFPIPCHVVGVSGAIVTVAFDENSKWALPQIEIPKLESPWVRNPTQVGDKGIARPAPAYLGGVSGLGGGLSDLVTPGNLSALVFEPISNANSGPIDQNAAQVQGPNGAIIRTTSGTTSQIVTDTNGTVITFGTTSLALDSTGITLTVGTNSVKLTPAALTMIAASIMEQGNVEITGTLASGTTGGGTATFNGNISAPDLIVGGKSTVNHNHTDPQGGTTGNMQN